MSRAFGYEVDDHGRGQIIGNRPAEYSVELLQNGYARVDHRPSGLTDLVEPGLGRVHSGGVNLPDCLLTEIRTRWGRS